MMSMIVVVSSHSVGIFEYNFLITDAICLWIHHFDAVQAQLKIWSLDKAGSPFNVACRSCRSQKI